MLNMREAGIGRVLVASLHQGISDILPTRLAFYENWLNAEGLREGTIGLAPLHAVLSFLRQEGDAYQIITTRAGEYAAEWTVASMPAVHRALIKAAPSWVRGRLLVGQGRRLVRTSYQGSRAISRMRRGTAERLGLPRSEDGALGRIVKEWRANGGPSSPSVAVFHAGRPQRARRLVGMLGRSASFR